METEIQLQLEALKLLQEWSMWIITLSTVFIGLIGFAFKNLDNRKEAMSAKLCISFLFLTVFLAVLLVGAIPAVIQKLSPVITDNIVAFGANARGVYGYLYLDFLPLWLLISSQRITFVVGVLFGAHLVWQKYGASV